MAPEAVSPIATVHQRPIAIAKGPGERPHEFTLISSDVSNQLKTGEFLTYQLRETSGGSQTVFARVISRRPVRLFPDAFLASPDVSPSEVAATFGHSGEQADLFEITARVMGHFDDRLGGFVNPRVLPRSGEPLFLAPAELLCQVLSPRQMGDRGSAHLGRLLARDDEDVPVVLDVNQFTSTHLSIIAGTGAGKSYLAGVIIEELLKTYNRGSVLIVDPHGEYDTLIDMCDHREFVQDGYRPIVKVLKPDEVKVRFSSLTLDDIRYLLPSLGERMEFLLAESFNRLHSRFNDEYEITADGLMKSIQDYGFENEQKGIDYRSSVDALMWRVKRQLIRSPNFDDFENLDLNAMFRPGQCTVLQLNEKDQRDQQVIVATVLRRLLKARMDTDKNTLQPGDESYLPYPVFVLIEEAHHFAPAGGDVVSSGVLKQVLAEGRKFGVGVALISQRPGKLDSDALSQCMTHVIMRIVNPVDQNSIAGSIESVGRDLLDELPALTKGQAVIAGSSLNSPVLIQTRSRLTRHGGVSIASAEAWAEYFSKRDERARDESLIRKKVIRRDDLFGPDDR